MKKSLFILILLFILALIPRLYDLNKTTIYPDEITWTVRGKEIIFALKQQNWQYFNSVWWESKKENESIALPTTVLSGLFTTLLGQGQSSVSLNLLPSITAARIPLTILNALLIPLFYLLAKRLVSLKTAIIASILLLLDPIHISLSRWVMLDGLLTLFTFTSIYLFILALEKRKWIPLAGLMLSLGFLTKPLGILPITAWVFLSLTYNHHLKNNLRVLALSVLGFFFYTWLLLPGSWDKPITAIFEYLWQQGTLGQEGYTVFFMGNVTTQPPFYFYLFQIFSRLPSLVIISVTLSFIFLLQKRISFQTSILSRYSIQLALVLFFISFLLAISLTPLKLGARYALPLWPSIYLLVALAIDKIDSLTNKSYLGIVLLSVLITSGLLTLNGYFPDYYFYYNSLVGGPNKAQKYDLIGHCLGTKPSLEFVDRCYPRSKTVTILGCSAVTAPYYFSRPISNKPSNSDITIVEYTYKQLLSDSHIIQNLNQQKLVYTAKLADTTISEVYSNFSPTNPLCSLK